MSSIISGIKKVAPVSPAAKQTGTQTPPKQQSQTQPEKKKKKDPNALVDLIAEDTAYAGGMGQGGNAGQSYRKFRPKSAGTNEEQAPMFTPEEKIANLNDPRSDGWRWYKGTSAGLKEDGDSITLGKPSKAEIDDPQDIVYEYPILKNGKLIGQLSFSKGFGKFYGSMGGKILPDMNTIFDGSNPIVADKIFNKFIQSPSGQRIIKTMKVAALKPQGHRYNKVDEGNPVNVWAYTGQAAGLPPDMKVSPLPIDIIGSQERHIIQKNTYDITKGKAARDLFYNTAIDKANLKTELEKLATQSKLRKDQNGQWVYDVYQPLLQHQKQALKYHLKHLEYMFGDPIKKEKVPKKTKDPEVQAESDIMRGLQHVLKQNPKGSAAEKVILKSFLKIENPPEDIDQDEWIDSMRQYLIHYRETLKNTFPELDFTDLDHLAQDLYVNYLYSQKKLKENLLKTYDDQYVESSIMKGIQEDYKSDFDQMINKMIKDIWGAEAQRKVAKKPRYLVYSQNTGLEMDTDSISDALFAAEKIAKQNLDSPSLVYDRKTKYPVVAYQGSEDMWYRTNPNSPRLHEDDTPKRTKLNSYVFINGEPILKTTDHKQAREIYHYIKKRNPDKKIEYKTSDRDLDEGYSAGAVGGAGLDEEWSTKYKKSINCNNPKGFSQKAHCAGRKARQAGKHTKSTSVNEYGEIDRQRKIEFSKENPPSLDYLYQQFIHSMLSSTNTIPPKDWIDIQNKRYGLNHTWRDYQNRGHKDYTNNWDKIVKKYILGK